MTNGIDHNQGNGKNSDKSSTLPKSGAKPMPATNPHSGRGAVKQVK